MTFSHWKYYDVLPVKTHSSQILWTLPEMLWCRLWDIDIFLLLSSQLMRSSGTTSQASLSTVMRSTTLIMDTGGLKQKKGKDHTVPIILQRLHAWTTVCRKPKKQQRGTEIEHLEDYNLMCAFQKMPFQKIHQCIQIEDEMKWLISQKIKTGVLCSTAPSSLNPNKYAF